MARIPEHVVEEVRARADLVGVVGRYVTLKKSGSRHWGLCPFHSEKTPSFQVHEERQIFHCFGCGASGDLFGFRMRHDGLDFPDAVRSFARELGIEIPAGDDGSAGRATPLYAVNEAALEFFRERLRAPEGEAARRYLRERGVTEELIERFQIGYAPAGWEGLCKALAARRLDMAVAEQAGLVAQRQTGAGHYDRFRNRVVFPIREPSGHVVGFGGRALDPDDTPKYLNSSESPIYRKGRVLFGLPLALDAMRARSRVVVVEGYFDLVALHRAGIEEGVAPCGTALTADHARRLRRYGPEVVLLFDADAAGQRAADRALPLLLAEGLRVRAAFLPAGDDPDTLVSRAGAEALRATIEQAVPLLDHLIEQCLKQTRSHAWDVTDAARRITPLLRALPDPVERAAYLRSVARRLDVPEAALEQLLEGDAAQLARAASAPATPPLAAPPREIEPALRILLGALVSYPDLVPLLDGLDPAWIREPEDRELVEVLGKELGSYGELALARLLSPEQERLSERQRAALSRVAAESQPTDLRSAEQAARDCLARLELRLLETELRALTARLETCSDSAAEDLLLDEKARKAARREELRSSAQQV